ncbi:MAG: hypothetical protein AVDCRST_MAG87-2597 [uncultured Thermomicrobiales bacterium]|uniref:Uncharacterized protein n=1 Tax=uncultured Thermomicrobiales bacterium TaxID=1645740 RepID=A0A6J4VBZ5_9BACT|nr:MAG: hypothetical protein AVDCRST_MAG87-2597 [uncultured Thermomicrobiales bacterium]
MSGDMRYPHVCSLTVMAFGDHSPDRMSEAWYRRTLIRPNCSRSSEP